MSASVVSAIHLGAASIMRNLPQVRGHGSASLAINRLFLSVGASPTITVPMVRGHRLKLDARVQSHVWAAFSGRYNDPQIEILTKLLPVNGVIFDVGANIGFYSVPLAITARAKNARLVAFEPFEKNVRRLRENLDLNSASAYASVQPYALSDRAGENRLELREDFLSGGETGNAVIPYSDEMSATGAFATVSIATKILDDIWPTLGVERLDLVKVDVEGHEIEFMRGGQRTLSTHRPIVQLEMNRGHYAPRGIEIGAAFTAALPPNYKFFYSSEQRALAAIADLSSYDLHEDVLAVPGERVDNVKTLLET